jgi:hypothetical protein
MLSHLMAVAINVLLIPQSRTFCSIGQGILACRAGTHETKKKNYLKKIVFSYFMHVSLFKTCRNA